MFDHDTEREPSQRAAMIGVVYDEFKPETYKRIEVSIGGNVTPFTGHFFAAYINASRFASENADETMHLSSVDDFAQDLQTQTDNMMKSSRQVH